jgi:NitT/TauT family transport system ATP-binding protein
VLALGGNRSAADPDFLYFHRNGASRPSAADGLWIYAQMARWGQLARSAAAQAAAARVFRPDLLERYVGTSNTAALPAIAAFDGIEFDGRDVDGYLARFDTQTRFVAPGSGA